MSSQTFHETYRLRRPELEEAIHREIHRGCSMRRVAEVLGINRKTVSRRLLRAERLRNGARTLGCAS
jgi:transposase-like protein